MITEQSVVCRENVSVQTMTAVTADIITAAVMTAGSCSWDRPACVCLCSGRYIRNDPAAAAW